MAQFNPYYVGNTLSEIVEKLESIEINEAEKDISTVEANNQREEIRNGNFPPSDLGRLLFIALLNIASEAEDEIVISGDTLSFYEISSFDVDNLFCSLGIRGFRIKGKISTQLLVELIRRGWEVEGYYPDGQTFRGVYFTR